MLEISVSEPNERFPLQPDYVGPDSGVFLFCHHDRLCGYVWSVRERVDYVRQEKPQHEQAIRASHFCLLRPEDVPEIPAELWPKACYLLSEGDRFQKEGYRLRSEGLRLWYESEQLQNETDRLWAESARLWVESDRLMADGYHLLESYDTVILSAARQLIPDCRWNGKEIDFT